ASGVSDQTTSGTYTLSLHDALPILELDGGLDQGEAVEHELVERRLRPDALDRDREQLADRRRHHLWRDGPLRAHRCTILRMALRSEEHTSELQSLAYLVCRLLLEKK